MRVGVMLWCSMRAVWCAVEVLVMVWRSSGGVAVGRGLACDAEEDADVMRGGGVAR